jgi:hypothetical protein
MATQLAFWLDDDFDRQHAPDGKSRYRAAVRQHLADFGDLWGDIAPVAFAVQAWQIAVGLDPGYVRWHRRVVSATCHRSAWDGSLTGEVTVAGPWPTELVWTKQWTRDRGWRDWPQLFGQYVTPRQQDLTRVPHLRTLLLVEAPIPLDHLPPTPQSRDDDVERAARRAVMVVARGLDELLSPMLAQLDASVPTDS